MCVTLQLGHPTNPVVTRTTQRKGTEEQPAVIFKESWPAITAIHVHYVAKSVEQ